MRFCGLFLGCFCVVLLAAACGGHKRAAESPLGATPPESGAGTGIVSTSSPDVSAQTQQAATSYWTPERMRNAKPLGLLVKHGKPKMAKQLPQAGQPVTIPPTPPQGRFDVGRVPNAAIGPNAGNDYPFPFNGHYWSGSTTSLPARTWGKVFFSAQDGDYVCSGTAVTSKNRSVVWTAGHCAADGGHKRFYTRHWIFVPGYDNGFRPYNRFLGREFFTTKQWLARAADGYDLAAVVVYPAGGQKLVDAAGGQGIAFDQRRSEDYLSGGYPAAGSFDGESLYLCEAPLGENDTSVRPATLGIGCDMTGGASGGGWLISISRGLGYLASVNSYGYDGEPDAMYGPYQGQVARQLYSQASAWHK